MSQQRRDWDEISRLDALWAILSDPAKRHGGWDIEEFLATGRVDIEALIQTGQRWSLPQRRRHALDFGCGVGRLTRALAAHFERVTGVDISEVMVSRARRLHADVPNCTFEILDDRGLMAHPDRSVDCVYSRLVLQHVPSRSAIEAYLRDFVRVLADGGLLVVQLPASLPMRRRLQVRPRLYATLRHLRLPEDVLYRRLGLHPIRMRSIPEADVVRLLTAAGATVLDVERSEMGDMGIQDRTYWATKAR